jgi:hypothetical protein
MGDWDILVGRGERLWAAIGHFLDGSPLRKASFRAGVNRIHQKKSPPG